MPKETKQYHVKEMTIADTGKVRAVFATLGVVDNQGDIIMPGAIEQGKAVRISAYNHASWGNSMPVGKGTISELGNELVFDGQFFLDTDGGAETYKTVKNLGDLAEWSFGFDVLEKSYEVIEGTERRKLLKLDTYEVSPVLLGAGINTRTLDIKSADHGAKTYQEHAELILEDVADFVKRSQSIAELRAEKGKDKASEKNRDGLKALASELSKAEGELRRLAETDTEADAVKARADVAALFAQFETNEIMRSA